MPFSLFWFSRRSKTSSDIFAQILCIQSPHTVHCTDVSLFENFLLQPRQMLLSFPMLISRSFCQPQVAPALYSRRRWLLLPTSAAGGSCSPLRSFLAADVVTTRRRWLLLLASVAGGSCSLLLPQVAPAPLLRSFLAAGVVDVPARSLLAAGTLPAEMRSGGSYLLQTVYLFTFI
jgi:hypothetical protein